VGNIVLSLVVVTALALAGVSGTFAGFVDTEQSEDNFIEAGISDLLVNGKNDPVGKKFYFVHAAPGKAIDVYVDVYNWGECAGGDLWMHFGNVVSTETGTKLHMGTKYVYDGVSTVGGGIPDGYRKALAGEPKGAGVWSSEPEKIAEVGGGYVGQVYIPAGDPRCMGEDYGSGITDRTLQIVVGVCDDGLDGILDDADDNGDGQISPGERAAHKWVRIPDLAGLLKDIACKKVRLGFLPTQQYGWIHVYADFARIVDPGWTGDPQLKYWRTNALQGDRVTWDMLFELITDP